MGPLSAASMEGSALQRGYQYLIQLHLLKDIEVTTNIGGLFTERPLERGNLQYLTAYWNDR